MSAMADTAAMHLHEDLEVLKRDVALIKHILSEEGKLTPYAKRALEEARQTPDAGYVQHADLKKRLRK